LTVSERGGAPHRTNTGKKNGLKTREENTLTWAQSGHIRSESKRE